MNIRPVQQRVWPLVAWVFTLLCAACSIIPKAPLNTPLMATLPLHHEITATPFIVQDAYQCGPASLAMVLGFYDHPRQPQELTPWLFTPDAKGSFPAELDAVARQQGFLSYPVTDLDSLLQEIAANHPVLVLQNLGTDWYRQWHFAVAIGYDLEQRTIMLRSGDLARRETPLDVFFNTWKRGDFWARAILPPSQWPASAQPLAFLRASNDLERTGQLEAARQAYMQALQHWPDEALAAFGLGNVLLQQQQFATAGQVLENLITRNPSMAAAWNNYAYALNGQGCGSAARIAARCARILAPEDAAIAATVHELDQLPEKDSQQCPQVHCPPPY